MIIEVTQADIDHGIPRSHNSCPVALAMTRQLGKDVLIGWNGISIKNCPILVKLPLGVHNFITDFDVEEPVEPFSFEVEIPQVELKP